MIVSGVPGEKTLDAADVNARPSFLLGSVLREGQTHHEEALGLQDGLHISHSAAQTEPALLAGTASLAVSRNPGVTVAVVCDGTSTVDSPAGALCSRNQVGAALSAHFLSRFLTSSLSTALHSSKYDGLASFEQHLELSEFKLRNMVASIAMRSGYSTAMKDQQYRAFIGTHFFFTVLGLALLERSFFVFGLGDGYFAVNHEWQQQGESTVLGQAWLRKSGRRNLKVYRSGELDGTGVLCISTDGVAPLAHTDNQDRWHRFCEDPLTCGRNAYGQDTTPRSFQKYFSGFQQQLHDDLAIVIAKQHHAPDVRTGTVTE